LAARDIVGHLFLLDYEAAYHEVAAPPPHFVTHRGLRATLNSSAVHAIAGTHYGVGNSIDGA